MKGKILLILTLVFCFAVVPAFLNFFKANAHTDLNPNPSPTPVKSVSPAVESSPEEEEGIIKIDTEIVNLNVRVVDRNNRSISNLSKNDFRIFEDNAEQQVDSFTKGEVPTNYAMVIDNSGSMRLLIDKVIEAGKIIINTNRADDETEIIRFVDSEKIEILQDFTSSKPDLEEALENMVIEGGQTAIIDAVYLAALQVDEYEKTRNPNDRKRRALILVSDGEDRVSFYKEQQLFERLRESDVQIYAVGFVSELSKEGGFIAKSPQGKAKDFLERLAKETGGKVYFPNSLNELNGIAQDIASELRTQYILSYYPTNPNKDGAFRAIKVNVADGPNKEKRIAVTRTGIQTDVKNQTPKLQDPKKVKTQ